MDVQISSVREGNNPRRYFDSAAMEELTNSVKANGIVQPIAVSRQSDDKYVILAGHRRYRAAVSAGLSTIPVHVVEGQDPEAVALIENTVRDDMSPAEESESAMRLLKKNNGDVTEVALLLGWTQDKLRRRIALSGCSQTVRDALAERKIQLGIAELLATVPEHDKQDKALEKILANKLTVSQVKDFLSRLVQMLESAIFDKTQCMGCRFNTSTHASLFEETIDKDACCTNSDCFQKKTDVVLQEKAASIKDDYPVVRIIRLGDPDDWTQLVATGNTGVGEAQVSKCHACANFGAIVSGLPGDEGKVDTSVCFDLNCHENMVKAKRMPVHIPIPPSGDGEGVLFNPGSAASAPEITGDDDDGGNNDESVDTSSCCTPPSVPRQSAMTGAMTQYRRSLWNMVGAKAIAKDHAKGMTILVSIIANAKTMALSPTEVSTVIRRKIGDDRMSKSVGTMASALDEAGIGLSLIAATAGTALSGLHESDVVSILQYLQPNIGESWEINKDFLSLMTKSEISSLADEIGVADKVDNWHKVIGGKKEQAIQAFMNSGMDFNGIVPMMLDYN